MQVLLSPVRKWLREGAREPLALTEFTRANRFLREHLQVARCRTHSRHTCLLAHILHTVCASPSCLLPTQTRTSVYSTHPAPTSFPVCGIWFGVSTTRTPGDTGRACAREQRHYVAALRWTSETERHDLNAIRPVSTINRHHTRRNISEPIGVGIRLS